jgi:hypothetical protein
MLQSYFPELLVHRLGLSAAPDPILHAKAHQRFAPDPWQMVIVIARGAATPHSRRPQASCVI